MCGAHGEVCCGAVELEIGRLMLNQLIAGAAIVMFMEGMNLGMQQRRRLRQNKQHNDDGQSTVETPGSRFSSG
mgnify:CR=1 FL=1